MKPLLTVTIPSYRQPHLLERALQALSIQTFKNFNVIILDDASGVDIKTITKNFANTLDITIYTHPKNIGAMNNILQSILLETEADYIFSHHEDDFIKSNYLEVALAILEKENDISYVISRAEWVAKETPFVPAKLSNDKYKTFSAPSFVKQITENTPFILGSVIYRRSHLISDWEYTKYNTLCDRVFLTKILMKHNGRVAYLDEAGIYVRDHSLDMTDTRAEDQNENHLLELYSFYKEVLRGNYSKNFIDKKITNGLFFGYSCYEKRSGLYSFYKKVTARELIKLRSLDKIGLYGILTLPFSKKQKNNLLKLLK